MASFEFTFNNNKEKPTGVVFARKRKPTLGKPPITKPKPPFEIKTKSSVKSSPKISNFEAPKLKTKTPEEISRNEPQADEAPVNKFIKRKGRKDKIIAKSQTNVDEGTKTTNLNTKPTSNTTYSLFSVKHKSVYVNAEIPGKSLKEKVFSLDKKFDDLNIHKHLVSNLTKHSFMDLTNVQEKSIPLIIEGKNVLVS